MYSGSSRILPKSHSAIAPLCLAAANILVPQPGICPLPIIPRNRADNNEQRAQRAAPQTAGAHNILTRSHTSYTLNG
jgi:hypothetical protein